VESASRTVIQVIAADLIAPVVLVNGSAGVAKNFCALELATTSALQVIFCLALGSMDSEDSGPGRHHMKKKAKKEESGFRIPVLVIAQTLLSLVTLISLSDTRCSYFDAHSADSCCQKWGKSFSTIFH
jgi:hypothetical protein